MKKLLMLGVLLSFQLNLLTVSAEILKKDANVFYNILNDYNNVHNSLDKDFLIDCQKLKIAIQEMVHSIDEIANIQKKSSDKVSFEQCIIINKHILKLNVVRKMLMCMKSNYQMSNLLCKAFDGYRKSIDTHYYELHPSNESYLLKEYNVSLKESMQAALYATGSFVGLVGGSAQIAYGLPNNDCVMKSSKRTSLDTHYGLITSGVVVTTLGAYLAYCAYTMIHNPEYEFEVISKK